MQYGRRFFVNSPASSKSRGQGQTGVGMYVSGFFLESSKKEEHAIPAVLGATLNCLLGRSHLRSPGEM